MAATLQQPPVPADVVGNAFVHQYYLILHQSPELVHRFYQDVSKLGRPEEGGIMSITTTMNAINEKILSLDYGQFQAEITSVDSQESYNGGVLVLVTGFFIVTDNVRRKFTQTFFLAPQEKGYFVLNDVLRYVDSGAPQYRNNDLVSAVEAPLANHPVPPADEEIISSEQTATMLEEVNGEVYDPPENGGGSIKEQEVAFAEVFDEVPVDMKIMANSNITAEEVPKKSYASIVKVVKENNTSLSSSVPSPIKSVSKSQENATALVSSNVATETHESNSVTVENGNAQENEAEGHSIYVKGLPLDATPALLETEFKRFGPIRPNGIQVRSQKGFCFGFVEFEAASAAQGAIEASPLMINGNRVIVEEKRSTSRGNKRGRFISGGPGGYRNEGGRGVRGNFGGPKTYNRGDLGNRSNGRGGGYPNRGGEGYRRTDKLGNGSGRGQNTGSRMNLNSAAKSVALGVTATA